MSTVIIICCCNYVSYQIIKNSFSIWESIEKFLVSGTNCCCIEIWKLYKENFQFKILFVVFTNSKQKKKKTKINYHLRFLIISIYLKNLIVCVPIIGPKVKVIRFCELLHSNEKNYINIHRCHQKNYNRFSISLKSQRERKIILN